MATGPRVASDTFFDTPSGQPKKPMMTLLLLSTIFTPVIAAAGWAFLVWLCGGGFGLAVVVFIVLKVLGK